MKGTRENLVTKGLGTVTKRKGTGQNLTSNVVKYYERKK